MFKGSYTALITPFKEDGSIDYEGYRRNINFQIENGINGIVPLGTTGETPTLEDDEKQELLKIAVKVAKKKIPIIAGCGTNSTSKTIKAARACQELGADALLVVNPYYNKPTQEGLYLHFKAVAESVTIPIILYNIKGRTGVNIETPTMIRLSKIKNITAVKEASGDLKQIGEVIKNTKLKVMSGDDGITLDVIKLGGTGIISVVSNLVPRQISEMTSFALKGKWKEAEKINEYLKPLYTAAFIETNPIPIKAMMNMKGMPSGGYRLPMCEPRPENINKIKKVLLDMRLI